jgi:hypothetical protein
MKSSRNVIYISCRVFAGILVSAAVLAAYGQVLPSEVTNYRARAAESKYLPQLETLQREIGTAKYPHPFELARYLNAKSGRASMDRDGLEFVNFQHRIILKVSGIYKVAFDAGLRTENQRVAQTLEGAGVPLLRMAAEAVPEGNDYDGIGLEIVYNTHDSNSAYTFEGREVLSVVFNRADAVAFATATTDDARQEILNRSDLYVSGKPFGVALGQRDPMDPSSSEERATQETPDGSNSAVLIRASAALRAASKGDAAEVPAGANRIRSAAKPEQQPVLRAKLEPPTDALAKDVEGFGVRAEHDVAPMLEKSGDQVLMHVKVNNSLAFDGASTSIYKRAAQSFDLFLGPALKELLKTVPADAKFDAFEFSVINRVAGGTRPSETVDYICPIQSTRLFVDNKITSQDLINQSTVLVNGIRIGLNLAAVE